VQITDFGFAKDIGDGRTWTLCGTPDYLGQLTFRLASSATSQTHEDARAHLHVCFRIRALSLCSAPEIVAGKGHGKGVDWWTLGTNDMRSTAVPHVILLWTAR
jgi:hypothetical protein